MPDIREGMKLKEIIDLSKGVQVKTTRFQQQDNEVNLAENVTFDSIGGFGKKPGYAQQNSDLVSTTSTSTSSSTTTTSTSSSSSTSTSTSTTTTA